MRTLLCLEEALENNPQTRSLLRLFEEDSSALRNYTNSLRMALVRVLNAQSEITASVANLSSVLAAHKDQNFPLDQSEYDTGSVSTRLSQILGEVGSWNEIMGQQLSNCVLLPVEKLSHELNSLPEKFGEPFHQSDADLDDAEVRFGKIHRKDVSRKVEELNNDVFFAKRNFHEASLKYYSRLNALQFLRYTHTIEPLLSLLYAWRSFFHMGNEALSQADTTDFFTRTQEQIQSIHSEYKEEATRTGELIQSVSALRKIEPDMYFGEPQKDTELHVDPTLSHKQGYMFVKSKSGILSLSHSWDRVFFFTQGSHLMSQGRDDLGGQILVDLGQEEGQAPPSEPVAVPAENEDRRFVIQLKMRPEGPSQKPKVYSLQARNRPDFLEWLTVLNNMAGAPQPEIRKDSSPPETATSQGSSTPSPVTSSPPLSIPTMTGDALTVTKSFETTPTPRSTPSGSFLRLNAALAAAQPISFDILATEGAAEMAQGLEAPSESFGVRFLGSMEVVTDRGDTLIHETMRQILAARAQHNIFRMPEGQLLVDENKNRLILIDSATKEVRMGYHLEDLAYWNKHPENERLFAFIARMKLPSEAAEGSLKGRPRFRCFVFEAQNSGAEVCHAISEGTKRAFQALLEKKTSTDEEDGKVVFEKERKSEENSQSETETDKIGALDINDSEK